jgi:hypothetical protein
MHGGDSGGGVVRLAYKMKRYVHVFGRNESPAEALLPQTVTRLRELVFDGPRNFDANKKPHIILQKGLSVLYAFHRVFSII